MSERIRSIQTLGFFLETLVASAARTASAAGALLSGFGRADTLRVQVTVTARSGTNPTLNVIVEDTLDDGVNWNTIKAFTELIAVGQEVVDVTTPFSDNIRVSWIIGGTDTPTFTFAVVVHAGRGAR